MRKANYFSVGAFWSLLALSAAARPAAAQDLQQPPWPRGAAGTTFQDWDFSAGNLAVIPPDAPVANNPIGPNGFRACRPNGNATYHAAFNGHNDVWELAAAGQNGNPPVGTLLLDVPEEAGDGGKELQLQVTYFAGAGYGRPEYDVFDASGPRYTLIDQAAIAFRDGWIWEVTTWSVSRNSGVDNVMLTPAAGMGAAIDGVVIDTNVRQIVIDGRADGSYQMPISLQVRETSATDNQLGDVEQSEGSELDAAYGTIRDGVLYLTLAGNLKSDGLTRLDIFFDSIVGGENQLSANNTNIDNFLNMCAVPNDATKPGLKFTPDFEADMWIGVACNIQNGFALKAWYALVGDNRSGKFLGNGRSRGNGALAGGNNPDGIKVSVDNSNTAGVQGGNAYVLPSNPNGFGVTTGVELAIPLRALGLQNGDRGVKVCALITKSDGDPAQPHKIGTNQVLDAFDIASVNCNPSGIGDLGDMRAVNLCRPNGINASDQRVMEVFPDNQEPFRFWRAGGAEDQRVNCSADVHSFLVGAPARLVLIGPADPSIPVPPNAPPNTPPSHHGVMDNDLKDLISPPAGLPPRVPAGVPILWALGQCYGGGFFDDLNELPNVQAGSSAARYRERSWTSTAPNPATGNREDWVMRFIASIGNGTNPAREMFQYAGRNDPYGPAANPTEPARRVVEHAGLENPVYFTKAGDALKLNTAPGRPTAKAFAILWCGDARRSDDDAIVALVKKLHDNGWADNQMEILYKTSQARLGAIHPLKNITDAAGVAIRPHIAPATYRNLQRLLDLRFNNPICDRNFRFLFFFVNDHGDTSDETKCEITRGGGDGGNDDDNNDSYIDPEPVPYDEDPEFPEYAAGMSGDMNCDGVVNNLDIGPFVLSLTNVAGYGEAYPACDIGNGDMNCDGRVDNFDIDPFVQCLVAGCNP